MILNSDFVEKLRNSGLRPTKKKKKGFLDIFTSGKKENFSNILEILNDQNTLLDIQETFNSYSNICKEELSKMPDNQYKDALYDIVINLDSRLT